MPLITQIYKPAQLVGQLYARPYGSLAALSPVGNALQVVLSHQEDVQRQPDMRALGGGTYAKTSRVSQVNVALTLADWNPVNFARSVFGTAAATAAGSVVDVAYANVKQGGLVRLARPSPSAVTVKIGAAVINPAGNYQVLPEGIFVLAGAADIPDNSTLLISSTHPEHVDIEALTTSAPELQLSFGGLNEADNGKPVIVDIWRVSSNIVSQLGLVQNALATLQVSAEVLVDPTKTGAGLSRFYRTQFT